MINFTKFIILCFLFLCVSCGKEKNDGSPLEIKKGTGRLVLNNSQEVLAFRDELKNASINDQVLFLQGNPPEENYSLVIEDIERGDHINIDEFDVTDWLSNNQKEMIKNHRGCVYVKFYDSTYTPETQERKSFFALGDISFQEKDC